MEPLNFEFVSISDAKKVADGVVERAEEKDWSSARRPQVSFDFELQPETKKWLDELPEELRPENLAEKFARVANKIALTWKRPVLCDEVFNELMIDHRGTRQGFPIEVAKEIAALADYYKTTVFPRKEADVWRSLL